VNDDRTANPASPAEQLRLDEELAARFQHALAGERLDVPLQAVMRRARRHRRRRSWRRYAQPQLAAALALIAVVVAAAVTVRAHGLARPQPPARPPQPTASPRPSGLPASTLPSPPPPQWEDVLSFVSRQGAAVNWTALPGTILTRGRTVKEGWSYGRIQRDPFSRPATDPSTGTAMVGIKARALAKANRGQQVRATARLRATRPGVTVVVRLSEWEGGRQVDSGGRGERRFTLPDTGSHQVGAAYQVATTSRSVYLEIWAIGLGLDGALFVDHATVAIP
jgi:hypothetical protein